jgi:hypothetical protein
MARDFELQVCNHCREAFIGPPTVSCPECQTRAVLTDGKLRRRIINRNKINPAYEIVKKWDAADLDNWLVRRMVDILTYQRPERSDNAT